MIDALPQFYRRSYRSIKERVKSNGLAIGAIDFDARGRSPMSRQRIHLSLGGEAGGRSPGFILVVVLAVPRLCTPVACQTVLVEEDHG